MSSQLLSSWLRGGLVSGVAYCCAHPISRCILFIADITSGCLVGSWCLDGFSVVPKLLILRRIVALFLMVASWPAYCAMVSALAGIKSISLWEHQVWYRIKSNLSALTVFCAKAPSQDRQLNYSTSRQTIIMVLNES